MQQLNFRHFERLPYQSVRISEDDLGEEKNKKRHHHQRAVACKKMKLLHFNTAI